MQQAIASAKVEGDAELLLKLMAKERLLFMRQIQELQSSFRQNASLFSDEHRRHMEMTSTANELRSIGNLTPKTLETPTIQISNTEESTARKESFSTLGFSDWAY